ncbi:MAG: acyl carrier protein [Thermoguttaceae bacterium]|jgi:acyl carrier protein
MEKIENEVRQFVVQNFLYGQDDKRLMRDSSLLDSGIIDSTGVLELIAFVEDKFGISVADDEMIPENLDSIENLAKFISRRQPA